MLFNYRYGVDAKTAGTSRSLRKEKAGFVQHMKTSNANDAHNSSNTLRSDDNATFHSLLKDWETCSAASCA